MWYRCHWGKINHKQSLLSTSGQNLNIPELRATPPCVGREIVLDLRSTDKEAEEKRRRGTNWKLASAKAFITKNKKYIRGKKLCSIKRILQLSPGVLEHWTCVTKYLLSRWPARAEKSNFFNHILVTMQVFYVRNTYQYSIFHHALLVIRASEPFIHLVRRHHCKLYFLCLCLESKKRNNRTAWRTSRQNLYKFFVTQRLSFIKSFAAKNVTFQQLSTLHIWYSLSKWGQCTQSTILGEGMVACITLLRNIYPYFRSSHLYTWLFAELSFKDTVCCCEQSSWYSFQRKHVPPRAPAGLCIAR